MPFPQHTRQSASSCTDQAPSLPEQPTETDMVVTPPEYLQEVHDSLGRAEAAYATNDLTQATLLAEEGLATIRLTERNLGPESVPPHYRALFHCLRIQPAFRAALALFKRGMVCRRQPGSETDASFRKAWQILGPAVAGLDRELPVEKLASDFPVAGRVLRGVIRLCELLQARLPPLVYESLQPGEFQI